MILLFDPIAFLDYVSLFFSQGDINNLFSTRDEEGENFSQCFNSNKLPLNAQNPQNLAKKQFFFHQPSKEDPAKFEIQ